MRFVGLHDLKVPKIKQTQKLSSPGVLEGLQGEVLRSGKDDLLLIEVEGKLHKKPHIIDTLIFY